MHVASLARKRPCLHYRHTFPLPAVLSQTKHVEKQTEHLLIPPPSFQNPSGQVAKQDLFTGDIKLLSLHVRQ